MSDNTCLWVHTKTSYAGHDLTACWADLRSRSWPNPLHSLSLLTQEHKPPARTPLTTVRQLSRCCRGSNPKCFKTFCKLAAKNTGPCIKDKHLIFLIVLENALWPYYYYYCYYFRLGKMGSCFCNCGKTPNPETSWHLMSLKWNQIAVLPLKIRSDRIIFCVFVHHRRVFT